MIFTHAIINNAHFNNMYYEIFIYKSKKRN